MANFITVITQNYLLISSATPCRHPIFLLLPVYKAHAVNLLLNEISKYFLHWSVLMCYYLNLQRSWDRYFVSAKPSLTIENSDLNFTTQKFSILSLLIRLDTTYYLKQFWQNNCLLHLQVVIEVVCFPTSLRTVN